MRNHKDTKTQRKPASNSRWCRLSLCLDCGVLARGFLRIACDTCRLDRVVAFSCKSRGICPSCGGRRMADTAAHLVDRVIPDVPVRQWVLSPPHALRALVPLREMQYENCSFALDVLEC